MSRNNNLPFPIGSTYGDGQTMYSTSAPNLEGKIYRADGAPSADGKQEVREYMIVRNSSGVALAGPTLGQRGLRFGTTAGWFNNRIRGYALATNDYGVIPDDALTTSVPANDLFYVHVRGPAKAQVASKTTGAVTFTAGKPVFFGRTGGLLLQLAAGITAERHPIGSVYEAITSGTTGNRTTVVMVGGLMQSASG